MTDLSDFKLSKDERALMEKHHLAVFAGRLIFDARPPITADQQRDIEQRINGLIPPDLLRLWQTAFGGRLAYDLHVNYPSGLHSFSMAELFYPDSQDYRTLTGWIDFEAERVAEQHEEAGQEWDGKLDILPFGGFEDLERVYVVTDPEGPTGQVMAWSQGALPAWTGELAEDSQAIAANSVTELFGQLWLYQDPFAEEIILDLDDAYEMFAAIYPLMSEGPVGEKLAARLHDLMRANVYDWRVSLHEGTLFETSLGPKLALESAIQADDVAMLQQLRDFGFDLSARVIHEMNALDVAARLGARACFDWLLEQNTPVEKVFCFGAGRLTAAQVQTLLDRGVQVDFDDIAYSAGHAEDIDALRLLCERFCTANPRRRKKLKARLLESAGDERGFAEMVRAGKAWSSYRTDQETDAHADALEVLAKSLGGGGGWLSRMFGRR